MKFLTGHSIRNSIEEMDTLHLMKIYDYMSGKKYNSSDRDKEYFPEHSFYYL